MNNTATDKELKAFAAEVHECGADLTFAVAHGSSFDITCSREALEQAMSNFGNAYGAEPRLATIDLVDRVAAA